MAFNISNLELLLVTLSVMGYAVGATAWTYFAMLPEELHGASSVKKSHAVVKPFFSVDVDDAITNAASPARSTPNFANR